MQKPVEVKATSTMTFCSNQQPLKATKGDFYYDILFQSTTTVHYCPTSNLIWNFEYGFQNNKICSGLR